MENSHDTEQQENSRLNKRINELEIKASFAEDLLDQLDKIITRQQQQIDLLIREVGSLRQAPTEPGSVRSLRDDLPPHF